MAYVRLPDELGGFATRKANGRIASFEFSVFAGETIACSAAPGKSKPRGRRAPLRRRLHLRSDKGDKRFEFKGLPSDLVREGDMAAVIAVLPASGDHGPIVGVANLDEDERIDFRWREKELLRILTGERRDYRRPSAMRMALAETALKALAAAGAAYVAMTFYLDPQALETPSRLAQALESAWIPEALSAAALAAVASGVVFGLSSSARIARKALGQKRALEHFWARVGHALGYAADRRESCRPCETVRSSRSKAPMQLAGPLLSPSRLLPAPGKESMSRAPAGAEREATIAATRWAADKVIAERRAAEQEEAENRRRAQEQEREARLRAEEKARRRQEEALRRAEEEARLQAEAERDRLRAEEEARLRAEEAARRQAELETRRRAEQQARLRAEEDARRRAEEEARLRAEEEAYLRAEEEERLRAEEEAMLRAEEEARRHAELEARRRAEREARLRAEEEARRQEEEQARRAAERSRAAAALARLQAREREREAQRQAELRAAESHARSGYGDDYGYAEHRSAAPVDRALRALDDAAPGHHEPGYLSGEHETRLERLRARRLEAERRQLGRYASEYEPAERWRGPVAERIDPARDAEWEQGRPMHEHAPHNGGLRERVAYEERERLAPRRRAPRGPSFFDAGYPQDPPPPPRGPGRRYG